MEGRNIDEHELGRSLVLSSSSSSSSITVVILGTVFAVSGSYVFGCAVSIVSVYILPPEIFGQISTLRAKSSEKKLEVIMSASAIFPIC